MYMGPTTLRALWSMEQVEWSALLKGTKRQPSWHDFKPGTLRTTVQRLNAWPHSLSCWLSGSKICPQPQGPIPPTYPLPPCKVSAHTSKHNEMHNRTWMYILTYTLHMFGRESGDPGAEDGLEMEGLQNERGV